MLKNASTFAIGGVDAAENEPTVYRKGQLISVNESLAQRAAERAVRGAAKRRGPQLFAEEVSKPAPAIAPVPAAFPPNEPIFIEI